METEETPIEEERRLFASNPLIWYIVIAFWIWAGYLLIGYFNYSIWIGAGYLLLFIGWFVNCYQIIKEDERAKPIFLGQIGKVIGSGPTFILWPAEKLLTYPTGVQKIQLGDPARGIGIVTKTVKMEGYEEEMRSISLGVWPVINFQWSWDDEDLTIAIKNAPQPTDIDSLKDKIEAPILDLIRTTGGEKSWRYIAQKRTDFARDVTNLLNEDKDLAKVINRFRLKNMTVWFSHIELPPQLKDSLIDYENSVRRGIIIATPLRIVREELNKVLLKYPDTGRLIETLITFREMGDKTTFYALPQEFVGALSRGLGVSAENKIAGMSEKIAGMSEDEFNQLIQIIKGLKKQ